MDRLTNEQLAFFNVIMAYANYTEYTSVLHAIGVWDNTEGNNAILFRDGQAYPIIWKTVDPDKPMVFLDAEGSLPARTWQHLDQPYRQQFHTREGGWNLEIHAYAIALKTLIISDIHANAIALQAVLEDAGAIDRVWCLGDVVGYGRAQRMCTNP